METHKTRLIVGIALLVLGGVLVCIDGMKTIFGCTQCVQYAYNAAYLLILLPLIEFSGIVQDTNNE